MTQTTIDGVTVDVEDTRAAIEELLVRDDSGPSCTSDYRTNGVAQCGDMLVHGDGATDPDGFIVNTETQEHTPLVNLYDALKAQLPEPFAEYVNDEFELLEVVGEGEDTVYLDGGSVDARQVGGSWMDTIGACVMADIRGDDNVSIGYVTVNGEIDGMLVNLIDERDDGT